MADMRLVGSKFTKISAERKPNFNGKLTMSTNIKMNNIDLAKEAKDTIKISYEFKVDYTDLGGITIEGELYISTDPKSIKSLQKSWKEKTFDTPEQISITNLIIQKASIKAFELEEEIGLPIHIRLPTLAPKKE